MAVAAPALAIHTTTAEWYHRYAENGGQVVCGVDTGRHAQPAGWFQEAELVAHSVHLSSIAG